MILTTKNVMMSTTQGSLYSNWTSFSDALYRAADAIMSSFYFQWLSNNRNKMEEDYLIVQIVSYPFVLLKSKIHKCMFNLQRKANISTVLGTLFFSLIILKRTLEKH